MRVLYLIKSFDFGGAENHVLDLANSMAEIGNDVYLITRKGLQAERLSSKVKFIPLRMNDFFIPFQVLLICYIVLRYRIDILHAHKRLAILQASLAGTIMNVPVVATVHGRPRYDLRSWISKRMTDKVIFVSGKTYESNRYHRALCKKSVLIHNGVRISSNNVTKNHFSLLYICRIDEKHSGVISMMINDVLPEIIRNCPMVTFDIVGDGKFIEELQKDADILNRQNNREVCKFHGYITDVRPLVSKSGLVMGVGRVALEALSCSVPVISLNRLFLGNLITRENYEFYQFNNFVAIAHPKPDPVKLADLLKDYLRDPEYWHGEADILRENVEENLDLKKITSDIETLYRELCVLKD